MGQTCSLDCSEPQNTAEDVNANPMEDSRNLKQSHEQQNLTSPTKTESINKIEQEILEISKHQNQESDIKQKQIYEAYNSIQMHDPPTDKAEVCNDQIIIQNEHVKKIYDQWEDIQNEIQKQIQINQQSDDLNQAQYISKQFIFKDTNDKYYGQWWVGMKHGYGQLIYANGNVYRGNFKNNLQNGEGKLIYKNGDYFEGSFQNGLRSGHGKLKEADGEVYKGSFLNNMKHGFGKLEQEAHKLYYEGEFKNGIKWGNGRQKIDDQEYIGEFVNDKYNGNGKCLWNNGKQYEGQFENSKMQGQGTYTWPDSKKYQGEFFEDVFNGYGEFYWPDGTIYKGMWKNGEMHGIGQIYTANKIQSVEFINGQKVKAKQQQQQQQQQMNEEQGQQTSNN